MSDFSLSRIRQTIRFRAKRQTKVLSNTFGGYIMKKLLAQALVLLIAMTITISTFAQSPGNTTRQRRTAAD